MPEMSKGLMDDTIAAIATPAGTGGIGIIRISGPQSLEIATRFFHPYRASPPFESHRLYAGVVIDPHTGNVLDEILFSYMAKPHSYTREDVVEMNCHGGLLVLREILSLLLSQGARLAEPGEFTKRAFLNGRLDLTQAEAVADLIESKTTAGLRCASTQLQGALSRELEKIRDGLLDILSELEAAIDFPEEDLDSLAPQKLTQKSNQLISRIGKLITSYDEGRLYREGVSAVIIGNPNVGKSSLFNALLGQERAIVTPLPGTTRDFVEEVIAVGGIPVKLMDTAGLRDPTDSIEAAGVEKTKEKLKQAELILLVVDGSTNGTVFVSPTSLLQGKRVMIVVNKSDLPQKVSLERLHSCFPESRIVFTSARYNRGLDELKNALSSLLASAPLSTESPVLLTHLRHKHALEKTVALLRDATRGLENQVPPEFISTDIQSALHHLGEITGQTTPEDLLDRIFSRFCIGK